MNNHGMAYAILYALAARDGREAALFGTCAPLAHDAFMRSCAGGAFPELWFELPLAGEPWFDLHALTSREKVDSTTQFTPEETGGYPEIFAWFATAPNVRQLALSYDVHTGSIDRPAIQLLVNDQRMHVPFLERSGGAEAAAAFRKFEQRLPEGWFPCYTGIFPDRPDVGVRVECIPRQTLQEAYAADPALLESHLRQAGLTDLGTTLVPRCQLLAQTPYQLEFQFNVRLDGTTEDILGASLRFASPPGTDTWKPFERDGATVELFEQLGQWGLVDDRWRLLADTTFGKRISYQGESVLAFNFPAFVKLRWREGEPIDAKTYLLAGIQ